MLDREPPAHTRLRGLVLRAFTSRRIAGLGPDIAALARKLADALDRRGCDLISSFAEPLPVIVIARLLGAPETMADRFLGWSHAMVAMYQARRDRSVEDAADAAARDFAAYLHGLVEERRGRQGDDLITALIAAESEGDRLSTDELIATCVLLLNAGHEATVHAIGNGVAAILASGLDPGALFATPAGHRRHRRGDPALRPTAPPLHPLRARGLRGLRPPLPARRHRWLPARGGEPRPGPLRGARPLRSRACPRAAPVARRRHPLLRRRAAGARRLAIALPILFERLPEARPRRTAGLRRPLPLPRADRAARPRGPLTL